MSKLRRDLLSYASVDLIARLISLVTSPITTRLLTLGQYGAGPLLYSFWTPISLFQFGGMDSAYPFFKAKLNDSEEDKKLLATATFASHFFSAILKLYLSTTILFKFT